MPNTTVPDIKLGQNGSDNLNTNQIAVINTNFAQTAVNGDDADFAAVTAASVQFTGGTGTQGTKTWNNESRLIDTILGNGVVYQEGHELFANGKNQTGVQIDDGTAVYISGVLGASGNLTIAPMIADGSTTDTKFFLGIATEDIPNGETGKVTTFGAVNDIDTTDWEEGDVLYISSTVAGELVNVRPVYPAQAIPIAIVVVKHEQQGVIGVRVHPEDDNENLPVDGSRPMQASLTLPKTEGTAILVGVDDPTYGWVDVEGQILTRGLGVNEPSFSVYRGGLRAYDFGVGDEIWITYHVPHDCGPLLDWYLHLHTSHNSASVTGGSTTWGYEVSYAPGHDTGAFAAPVTGTIVAPASATQYQHIITEIQLSALAPTAGQLDTNDIVVDGLVLARLHLVSNDMTGATPDPYLHIADCHIQSTGLPTKQKAPPFYT